MLKTQHSPRMKILAFRLEHCLLFLCFNFSIMLDNAQVNGLEIDCQDLKSQPFQYISHEVSELEVSKGSVLMSIPLLNCSDLVVSRPACDYLEAVFDWEHHLLNIILSQDLQSYREKVWLASMEAEFNLYSSTNEELCELKFILLLKDENVCKPKFENEKPLEYKITIPWDFERKINENSDPIRVVDLDYNKENANVTILCEGEDCTYLNFIRHPPTENMGYHYTVDLILHNSGNSSFFWLKLLNKKKLEVQLVAEDKDHRGESLLTIYLDANGLKSLINNIDGGRKNYGRVEEDPKTSYLIIGAVLIGMLLLVTGFVAKKYYIAMRTKKTSKLKKLTPEEVKEFFDGMHTTSETDRRKSVIDTNTPAFKLPFNRQFELDRESIKIDETSPLGRGHFGVVFRGKVTRQDGQEHICAVKTVKKNVSMLYFKALLTEIKIMTYIGSCPNIVSLIGACTQNIRKREVFIAEEYCSLGNLAQYLKLHRNNFKSFIQDGKFNQLNGSTYALARKNSSMETLTTMDLMKWSIQIANGLEYIASKDIVHGDLACRNMLLTEDRIVKIADFGLSKRLADLNTTNTLDGDPYTIFMKTVKQRTPLPWRWLALEVLKEFKFSLKSDIWAFGVLLWEIFSLSETPYGVEEFNHDFIEKLEQGDRLQPPKYSTVSIYEIMTSCWRHDSEKRPEIHSLKAKLKEITSQMLNDNYYLTLCDPVRDQDNDYSMTKDNVSVREAAPSGRKKSYFLTVEPAPLLQIKVT